jgi:hypothetical protein
VIGLDRPVCGVPVTTNYAAQYADGVNSARKAVTDPVALVAATFIRLGGGTTHQHSPLAGAQAFSLQEKIAHS